MGAPSFGDYNSNCINPILIKHGGYIQEHLGRSTVNLVSVAWTGSTLYNPEPALIKMTEVQTCIESVLCKLETSTSQVTSLDVPLHRL